MNIENGKEYIMTHSRKGMFAMRVDSQCDEWISGVIVGGKASAMMAYNEKVSGDEITVRRSFICKAIEQPLAAQH